MDPIFNEMMPPETQAVTAIQADAWRRMEEREAAILQREAELRAREQATIEAAATAAGSAALRGARLAGLHIPKFKGTGSENFATWLRAIRASTAMLPIAEQYQVWTAGLEGGAADRFTFLGPPVDQVARMVTQDQLAEAFRVALAPEALESPAERELRFSRRLTFGKGFHMKVFVDRFIEELARTDVALNFEEQQRHFLAGLLRSNQKQVVTLMQLQRFTNLQELMAFANRMGGFATTGDAGVPGAAGETAAMDVNAIRSGGGSAKTETRTCYNCNRKGHIARDCRSAPTRGRGGRGRRGGGGGGGGGGGRGGAFFIGDDDDDGDGDDAERASFPIKGPTMSSRCQSVEEETCLITLGEGKNNVYEGRLTGPGGERRVKVLIDSGASRNMIRRSLAKELGQGTIAQTATSTRFTFANGTTYISTEKATLDINIQEYEEKVTFLVCPMTRSIDVILGMEWMRRHNPDINWRTGTLTIPNAGEVTHVDRKTTVADSEATASASRAQRIEVVSASNINRLLRKPGELAFAALTMIPETSATQLTAEEESPTSTRPSNPNASQEELRGLLGEGSSIFRELFEEPRTLPTQRGQHDHSITLTPGEHPPYRNPFRLSHDEAAALEEQLKKLRAQGFVQPSSSPYGAPVVFAKKKDGGLRLCVDYRALNKITVRDRYPLPNIGDLVDRLQGATIFSKLDLRSGYHQIRMAEKDIPKTAFVTHLGSFEWRVLPMGLTNAPATFQRLMNHLFTESTAFVAAYLDDIIIFSKNKEEHKEHIRYVLETLRKNKMSLNPKKCEFGRNRIHFLGHVIGENFVQMEPDKVDAVRNWTEPTTKKELQAFLGFTNFYRRFIRGYAEITSPLSDLTSRSAGADGSAGGKLPSPLPEEAKKAFDKLKEMLTSAPALAMVKPKSPFILYVDASNTAVGAALHQQTQGREAPVAYSSKKLSAAERNYAARDKELLALVSATKTWRHYLMGRPFVVMSDHESLKYLTTMDLAAGGKTGRLARWMVWCYRGTWSRKRRNDL